MGDVPVRSHNDEASRSQRVGLRELARGAGIVSSDIDRGYGFRRRLRSVITDAEDNEPVRVVDQVDRRYSPPLLIGQPHMRVRDPGMAVGTYSSLLSAGTVPSDRSAPDR